MRPSGLAHQSARAGVGRGILVDHHAHQRFLVPEAVIERDYVLAWFLTGLAGHPLREVLAFKGGTALRRC